MITNEMRGKIVSYKELIRFLLNEVALKLFDFLERLERNDKKANQAYMVPKPSF